MLNAGESERVLVVGGGIAGLATAAALQRQGIAVAVYERRPLPPDGGLGLNLPGNAIAALNTLGLACRLADLGAAVRRREYRSRRDRLLFAVDEDRYWGGRVGSRCVRRSDLHAALHDLLVPGTVRLGAHVRGVRAFDDGVKLTLSDGTRASGGALVGADGVHSVVRGLFARGHRVKAATLSPASWRFGTTNPGVGCWVAWTGGPGTVLLIPMGGDRLYGSVTCGDAATDFAETCAASRRFPQVVRDVLASAAAADEAPLRSPLEEVRPAAWTAGRIVLVGDAAHATAPVWAQGAALAIEDALVLADVLLDRRAWSRAGEEFERRRQARVEHVQAMTDRFSGMARLPSWVRTLLAPSIGPRSRSPTSVWCRVPTRSTRRYAGRLCSAARAADAPPRSTAWCTMDSPGPSRRRISQQRQWPRRARPADG